MHISLAQSLWLPNVWASWISRKCNLLHSVLWWLFVPQETNIFWWVTVVRKWSLTMLMVPLWKQLSPTPNAVSILFVNHQIQSPFRFPRRTGLATIQGVVLWCLPLVVFLLMVPVLPISHIPLPPFSLSSCTIPPGLFLAHMSSVWPLCTNLIEKGVLLFFGNKPFFVLLHLPVAYKSKLLYTLVDAWPQNVAVPACTWLWRAIPLPEGMLHTCIAASER